MKYFYNELNILYFIVLSLQKKNFHISNVNLSNILKTTWKISFSGRPSTLFPTFPLLLCLCNGMNK